MLSHRKKRQADRTREDAGKVDSEKAAPSPEAAGPGRASAGAEPESPSEFGAGRELSAEELEELRARAARSEELFNQLQRTSAELQNLHKRLLRDKESARRLAVCDLLRALLPSFDNLERALDCADSSADALVDGIRLTREELHRVLSDHGVLPVDPEIGKPIDPSVHEAVARLPSTEAPENAIVQVLERGYVLGDLVIRPARVMVSSGEPAMTRDEGEEGGDGADDDNALHQS